VRNVEAGFAEDQIAVKDEIEVEGARAVGNFGQAVAAEFVLDGEKSTEQLQWAERSLKQDGRIGEAGLIRNADGRGGVKRRAGGDAAETGKESNSGGKGDVRRAGGTGQVAAEGDGGREHAGFRVAE
jgi:hypothetical protein